jgi:DNA-binding LacI/PurR family transcriptional regulator
MEHKAIETAARDGVPLVVWGAKLPRQRYVSIGTDNLAGGDMATRHLLERGRRHIAFLGDRRVPEVAQRFSGYTKALEQAGLKPNPGLNLPIPFGAEDALKALGDMVRSGRRIDGVVAASDVIAMSAIRALVEAGIRVPEDVSVVGFDDLAIARFTSPPLTTIRQDVVTGARLLVDKLLAIMAGQKAETEQMQPELVVRSSS